MKTSKKAFLIGFLGLAAPIILQSLSGTILGVVDAMMVGSISEIAISGVTVANKTFVIYDLIIFGATSGISIFLAQYYGAGDEGRCRSSFWFGMRLVLYIGIAFMAALLLMPDKLIKIYVEDTQIIGIGIAYIKVVRYAYIPEAVSRMAAVYFRICNKQRLPMYAGLISVISNILLNYILIFGKLGVPRMGIEGAALGTVLAKFLEMLVLLIFVWREKAIKPVWGRRMSLSLNQKLQMMKKVLPLILNEAIWALSQNIVFLNYCNVNEDYIPALTVTDNIYNMIDVIIYSCAVSAGVIIGEKLGAGEFIEAKRTSRRIIKLDMIIAVGCCILVFATAPFIPSLFSMTGKFSMSAITLLRIKVAFCWTQGYWDTVYYTLRAGGDTRDVFLVDGFFMLCGPVLVSTLAVRFMELSLPGVFLLVESTYLIKSVVALYLYKKGRWVKNITARTLNSRKKEPEM